MGIPLIYTPLLQRPARQVMLADPPSLGPKAQVREALEKMHQCKSGCVITVEGGKPVGIFTERDVLRRLSRGELHPSAMLEEVMTPNPVALGLDTPIHEAMRVMNQRGIRHLILVDSEGGLAGVVLIRHITEALAESCPEAVLNLPPRIHQKMKQAEGA